MDRRSTKRLRLDRRLAGRRDWISKADLQKELDALPDVGHKAVDPDDDEPAAERSDAPDSGAAAEPQAQSEPSEGPDTGFATQAPLR